MKTKKISTIIDKVTFTFDSNDNSLVLTKKENNSLIHVIPENDLKLLAESYFGMNRIYKPMALLFWIDCKNNKSQNWITF